MSSGKRECSGPTNKFLQLCKKYDLLHVVKDAIENCIHVTKEQWKKMVIEKVWFLENRKWNVSKCLFQTLGRIQNLFVEIQLLPWWEYTKKMPIDVRKCRIIIKLLLDCHMFKSCKYRYNNYAENPYCDMCEGRCIEDVDHVLFQCAGNEQLRCRLWAEVQAVCPPNLYRDLMDMTITNRSAFLLCGLGKFTPEWTDLYSSIANYIYSLYIERFV